MMDSPMTRRIGRLQSNRVSSLLILGMGLTLCVQPPSIGRASQQRRAEWIRASEKGTLIWGIKGGVVMAVWPSGFRTEGTGGPRGLFRVGYERDGEMRLVNFVAVEPIVGGTRGFSELELSSIVRDSTSPGLRHGKFIWPSSEYPPPDSANRANAMEDMRALSAPGWLSHPLPGVEQLNIGFDVEKFNNSAHPWIVVSIRSDRPDEVIFTVHAAPDSAPMRSCILTATMGNYIRARHLWLRDRIVGSKMLWPDPMTAGVGRMGFTRDEFFEEDSMCRLGDGSLSVAITTDEDDPSKVMPEPANWRYGGRKVTQYWRAHPRDEHPVRIRVNGRFVYWMSRTPIPNGVTYENFELVQDYFDGQQFIFGVTEQSPTKLEQATRRLETAR